MLQSAAEKKSSICLLDTKKRLIYVVPMRTIMYHAGSSVSLQCANLKVGKLFDVVYVQA